jgi:hypothetical protein
MHPFERPRNALQFRLSYLLYLLTLVALGSALLRRVLDIRGGWQFTAVMAVYLAALVAYFAIRVPLLVRRLGQQRRRDVARRAELKRMLDEARRRSDGEPPG